MQTAQHELSGKEWLSLTGLMMVVGGAISFAAIYQAFKVGSFIPGSMASAVLAWPVIRYWVAKHDPDRAPHLTNYLQTAVSASGSAVGMGSMLLAYQWVEGKDLGALEVVAMALPGSLFGVAVANLFAKSWINTQKLAFPTGTATGAMLNGLAQGGKAFTMLALGGIVAVFMFIFGSPIGALVIGAGWIIGGRVMFWAMLTALVFQFYEPALQEAGLIEKQYREFSVYLGACMIMAAGAVDMAFIYFDKSSEGDNPKFGEIQGFMSRGSNIVFILATAGLMSLSMWFVFDLPPHVTFGLAMLLIILIYIGGTCLGKTDLGPVSPLSGFVILLAGSFGKGGALLYGAAAGQSLANGMDQVQDIRTGERVGSHLPIQRNFQIFGAAFGASICLGLMYALLTSAYPNELTYDAVRTEGARFDAGFALKYYGFLTLSEKLNGTVGIACAWTLGITAAIQIARNLLKIAGKKTLADWAPSPYAASFATFVGFNVTWQESVGALIGGLFLVIWYLAGTRVPNPANREEEEPRFLGLNWSYMIGIPGGLIVGESLCGFVEAIANLIGAWLLGGSVLAIALLVLTISGVRAVKRFESVKSSG